MTLTCADLVNAMVDEYMSRFVEQDRRQYVESQEWLDARLTDLTNIYAQRIAQLEDVRRSLTAEDGNRCARAERMKFEVEQLKLAASRTGEKLLEARLADAEVDGNWDEQHRLARTKLLEQAYDAAWPNWKSPSHCLLRSKANGAAMQPAVIN